MNEYVTGKIIKELREKLHLTQAEETDERHMIFIERIEDEYYVRIDHEYIVLNKSLKYYLPCFRAREIFCCYLSELWYNWESELCR